ncbi:Uncharacterized protein FKW44_021976, partial [Caligus rogercresseyi]
EIMKTACMARNTIKSIRSELEESNNDYKKVMPSDGDVMPPHFFPKGLRLDSEGYVVLMRD